MIRIQDVIRDRSRKPDAIETDEPSSPSVSPYPVKELKANVSYDTGPEDLTDTIRRICTLSGWSRPREGVGRSMAITSALDSEGKSSLARAIAISTAADLDQDVLLVESDFQHPSLCAQFDATGGPGLSEILSREIDLTPAVATLVRPSGVPNLWLLPAGEAPDNPSRLLRSPRMAGLLDQLALDFPFVVLDLPAVLKNSDAAVLARLASGVIFVVRGGATEQQAVQQALWLLTGATIHGVVLNRARPRVPEFVRRFLAL